MISPFSMSDVVKSLKRTKTNETLGRNGITTGTTKQEESRLKEILFKNMNEFWMDPETILQHQVDADVISLLRKKSGQL